MESFSQIQIYFKIKEIREKKDRIFTFPASQIIHKTSGQIIQESLKRFNFSNTPDDIKNYHLYICSKKISNGQAIFNFEVPKKINPINFFNAIPFFPMKQTQEFSDIYLIISQKSYPSFFEIPLYNGKTRNFLFSFPVYVEFPFLLSDVIKSISSAFPDLNPETDIKIFNITGTSFDKNYPFKEFQLIQNILKKRFCVAIFYEEHDKTYTKILCRESVIKEIFERVNKNYEFYENIDKAIMFLSQCPQITPDVIKEMSSQTPYLRGLHQELKKKIDKFKRTDYMAPVGFIFSKFLSFFHFYRDINILIDKHQIISILKQNQEKFLFNAEFLKLSNNRPIDQYFNFLFKTIFDYQELFKNLFKYTPASHPDYNNCKKTVKDFKKVVSDINASMILEENQGFYELIRQRYCDNVHDLGAIGTQFIASYVICTKKIALQSDEAMPILNDSFKKRLIILLSNCIILAKPNASNEFEYQNSYPLDMYGFYPYKDRGLFYSFYEDPITYNTINENVLYDTNLIEFQTSNERNEFFNLYRHKVADLHPVRRMKSVFDSKQPDPCQPSDMFQHGGTVKIETIHMKKQMYLSNHSFVYHSDEGFFSFGGKNESGTPIKSFKKIYLNGTVHQLSSNSISERYDTLMVNVKDSFYIYGGTTDGITPLNELYKFEISKKRPISGRLATKSMFQPIPSFGYDLISFPSQNYLILIGGSSEFNCYHYLIAHDQWRKKRLKGIVLKSLVGQKQ